MGKIRRHYLKAKSLDKIIGGVLLTSLFTAFAAMQDFDWMLTGVVSLVVFILGHIFITYPSHTATTIVVAVHSLFTFVMSLFYGQLIFGTFGYSAAFYAFSLLVLVSIIYGVIAFKFSPGRLWLTLLLVFVTLDIGGIVLIGTLGINNMLVPLAASALVLLARCLLWRNLLSRGKVDYSVFKDDEAVIAAKTIFENIDNATVSVPDAKKYENIDVIVESPAKNYFVKVVKTKKPIHIHPKGISSNGIFIDGLLVLIALDAAKANRKKKPYKSYEAVILNMNDASSSKKVVKISPRNAKTRAVEVAIASPAALVKEIIKSKNA